MSELVASQKVMRHYLNALLTEEQEPEISVETQVKKQLQKLQLKHHQYNYGSNR